MGKNMHYHIRWSTKELLDWAAFPSRAEAEASAKQLVRSGETYVIEERDESCPRCLKSFNLKRPARNPNQKYSWYQSIREAAEEPNKKRRTKKVMNAHILIARRLAELTPADLDERAALRAAVRTLRSLVPERKPGASTDEEGIA